MTALDRAEINYLIAFPDVVDSPTSPEKMKGLKDAPYFQPVDIHLHTISQETQILNGTQVAITRQHFDDRVQMIECRFVLDFPLSENGIQNRQQLEVALQELFIPSIYRSTGLYEVYVILLIKDRIGLPEEFIVNHNESLARFIRSQREILDESVVRDILYSRISYSREDLTLVDWEAALIFAPEGDFQSDIELLKIGNYQLLRYRILGQSIDEMLKRINDEFKRGKQSFWSPARSSLRDIVTHRLELMLDFEHNEQNLLFIGDWYTAKLYTLISEEFYLANWKNAVQTKLDNLQGIITIIKDNFMLTWRGLLENLQLAGWLILLVGYFILFIRDLLPAK